YLVKRGNDRLTLLIPEDSRYTVGVGLFGKRDFSFVTQTDVPFFKDLTFNYALLTGGENLASKILYILVVIFIVTAVSNGVNLTDGLDGLAAGTTAIVAMVFAILAYVSGNAIFADYLHISFIPASGELLVFCAALVGACIGFLWFNTYPAQIFMGDTGSLALGGVVGVLALMVKKELLLPIICGVYFVESLSVIAQVVYFKYTKRKYGEGRRIFRMAPLHHHYELLGWHEAKIVSRFWIITVLLALLAFATLKLR
ncbi:MAG: phospho-N-acetylmuramoyl-pentapeptide-transferase, partial [Pseudomonadota bacterium]